MVSLLSNFTRIPAGADFGSQSHMTSNSAASRSTSPYMASILLSTYSTSIVQELALKYTHNCHGSIKDRHYKSLSPSTSGAFLDRVSCNIRHHQHDSEAISRGIIAGVPPRFYARRRDYASKTWQSISAVLRYRLPLRSHICK